MDHKGTEIADRAAKTGCHLPEKQSIPISRAHVKEMVHKEMYKEFLRWPNKKQKNYPNFQGSTWESWLGT